MIELPDTTVSCVRLVQLKYVFEAKAAGTLRETGLTPEKALLLIECAVDGIVTDTREVHPLKAWLKRYFTDDGMLTDVRDVQPWKAFMPIVNTDDGMLTVLRAVQPLKALSGILMVPSGMIASPFASGAYKQIDLTPFKPNRSACPPTTPPCPCQSSWSSSST